MSRPVGATWTDLGRADGVSGQVVLRRRDAPDGALVELVVGGVLVMDDADATTERELASSALAVLAPPGDAGWHVLVGGLGLGFTLAQVLADPRVGRAVVAELEPAVVGWVREGLVPTTRGVLDDPRTHVVVGDVADVLAAAPRHRGHGPPHAGGAPVPVPYDAVLLDVDNGPGFLVDPTNAGLYSPGGLARAVAALSQGGVLAVWCSHEPGPLVADLRGTPGVAGVDVVHRVVLRERRELGYWLVLARRRDRRARGSRGSASIGGMAASTEDFRIEHDTMGEVRVPAAALWRAQTQRAVENFPISGTPLERRLIEALARVKKNAALANAELGVLPRDVADAVAQAAEQVALGEHDGEFPVDVFQTGSGTSSNMNANEVVATLATTALGSPVHPNDHVNASQSSNDVFPTAVHVAATSAVLGDLVPALEHLAASLERKAAELADVVKAGRTHLMDATPVTLGQEFGGYAAAVRYGVERVRASLPRVAEVPLGGTAVGTGINTPAGFPQRVIELLAADTGLPLTEARDHFEAQGARDGLVELSGQLRTIAVSLTKVNNDLRWMGSGPNTGLGELRIPDLQPGSSIMPGKVNPVVCEAVLMVCAQVVGNDAAVAWAGASGSFELNVQIPVMGRNVLESTRLLSNACRVLADRVVDGLEADVEQARHYAEASPSIVTPLNRVIGYEAAAKVAKHAVANGVTVRQAVVDLGFVERGEVTEAQLDTALDVMSMTRPPSKAPAQG